MINKVFTYLSIHLIKLYQLILSPDKWLPRFWLKGRVCRHEPHCSQYALEYLERFWFFKSIIPIIDRVSECTAGSEKIIDPVPEKNEKAKKWKVMDSKALRVVFFSSAPIWVPFLEALWKDDRFQVVGVVTQPDQPSGRGLEVKPSIIKKFALKFMQETWIVNDAFIQTPQTLKLNSKQWPWEGEQFHQWLHNLHPDYFVVTAYGKVVPQHILDIPTIAPINIHRSLLPLYRWATPIQTTLLNGDQKTGITLIVMSAGLDEWDIVAIKEIDLNPWIHADQLYEIFASVWPDFVNAKLEQFAKWEIQAVPQNNNKATFTQKIEKEQGQLDIFTSSLEQVLRTYNAYYWRPKIYFLYKDKRVIIESLEVDLKKYENTKSALLVDNKHNLNPAVTQLFLKPEGKKTITRDERKRGYLKPSPKHTA